MGCLTVGLGDTLDGVLGLDGVTVGRTLGGVDDLISDALGDGLLVAETGFTGAVSHEVDGLAHTAEGRDVDGLAADDTSGTDAGGVLTGSRVDDSINVHLDRVLAGLEVDELEGGADDVDGEDLLTGVAAGEHQGDNKALDDGALGLAEALGLVAALGVRQVDGVLRLDGDVVLKRDVVDLDIVEGPLVEELGLFEGHGGSCEIKRGRKSKKESLWCRAIYCASPTFCLRHRTNTRVIGTHGFMDACPWGRTNADDARVLSRRL